MPGNGGMRRRVFRIPPMRAQAGVSLKENMKRLSSISAEADKGV